MTRDVVVGLLLIGCLVVSELLVWDGLVRRHLTLRRRRVAKVAGIVLAMSTALAIAGGWAGSGLGMWLSLVVVLLTLIASTELPDVIDARRPRQRLWRLNQEACRVLAALPENPELSGRLWDLVGEMEDIDDPGLLLLRQMLTWRYHSTWDPQPDLGMMKAREVLIDQLERRIWPPDTMWPPQLVQANDFVRGLHQAVGELVEHVRGHGTEAEPTREQLVMRLEKYRRPDTEEIIDQVIGRVSADQLEASAGEGNIALPMYRLPDGVGADRGCFDSGPLFGMQLSAPQVEQLQKARLEMIDRLLALGRESQ